ncbi:MAG: NUDIX domain-containing protein [bacterium]
MIRHFNVTTYIYNQKDKKFLFILHKKLNKWVAPGGHIEDNENPEAAALREVKEETGLDVELVGNRYPEESDLMCPYGIQKNVIAEGEHEHFDLIYLAFPVSSVAAILNKKEANNIKWFSLDEIIDPLFNSFEKNKKWCSYFSNELKDILGE